MSKEAVKNVEKPEYDSNPFSLSFRGLGLLIDYAKSVFIALLVLGILSFFSNIPNFNTTELDSKKTTSSTSLSSEELKIDEGFLDTIKDNIPQITFAVILIFFAILLVAVAFGSLIGALVMGTIAAGANSAVNKKNITLGESFRAMSNKFSVLYAGIFYSSCRIIGGYLLFIVPGIRAQLRYSALPFIIMNEDISASDAMDKSKTLYENHLMEVFGISTVGSIIPVIGQAVFASGLALSYQQISAYNKANLETPKTHWLNYLGLIFILFIFVIALLLGAILASSV